MAWESFIPALIQGGSGIAAALFGGDGDRLALDMLGKGTGTLQYFMEQMMREGGSRDQALGDVDAANLILSSVEPGVLQGFDESSRIRMAQEMLRTRQESDMIQQRMATAGLDSTTVAPAAQRSQAFGQAQRVGNIAAEYAMGRGQALASARGMAAQGLMNRANVVGQWQDRLSSLASQRAAMFANTQIVDQSAENIGALGAGISDSVMNAMLMNRLFADEE